MAGRKKAVEVKNIVGENVIQEIGKKEIILRIISMNEVIKRLKTEVVSFKEVEEDSKTIDIIKGGSYQECYMKYLREKPLYKRSTHTLNTVGLSEDNTIYCIMGTLIGNVVLIEKNTGAFRVGEAEMSKSSMTSLVFANVSTDSNLNNSVMTNLENDSEDKIEENSISSKPMLLVRGGIPTEPWLRGKELSLKNYDEQKVEKVPLEYPTLVFEEIMGISDIDNTIQYIKQITESGRFLKHNQVITKTETSFLFVANNYMKGYNLQSYTLDKLFSRLPKTESGRFLKHNQVITKTETSFLFVANNYMKGYNLQSYTLDKLFSRLPKIFLEDEAIFHRYPFIIPHYKKTFGEIKFVNNDTTGIYIEDFARVLKELKEKKCLINLEKYNLKNRQLRNFYKGISSFIKIVYPESVIKENVVPEWVIDGVFEFVKHFNSFTLNKEVYNPFNANSAKFIAEMSGFSIEKIEWVMFDEERILIKNFGEDIVHKIGLTGYGIEQNIKEYAYYQENPENILDITFLSEEGKHMKQKAEDLYSEDIIWIGGNKKITDDDFNKWTIKKIEEGSFNERFDVFKGIPDFFVKIAEIETKRIFQCSNPQVTKKNFVLVDGEIKFVNFSKFIREDNEE